MSVPESVFSAADEAAARALIARTEALATVHDAVHAGTRVRWRRFGPTDAAGPPLVLLHGGHGSWMHWLRNVPALSAGRALWLPDLPGYLGSDTPPAPAPAAGQAPLQPLLDVLQGTLDGLVGAGTPIALGGFSFGGIVAAKLAVQRGHIARLALAGSGGHATLRHLAVEMVNWRAAPDRDAERAALAHNLKALMLHDPAALDALAFEIHDIACHATRFRSKDASLAGGLQQALDAMDERGVPQLLLWGERDVTADARALVAALTRGHPLREGCIVEGAGHWVQFEAAQAFDARLLRFLGPG
ncbi:alpha/beta fold hydrolase [Xenophilus sp.]|uniref:alpha/beta fold hydrolase n=1 Tax=Xenophilus sp. TaxID=1873499 RepID=UPI0037DC98F8